MFAKSRDFASPRMRQSILDHVDVGRDRARIPNGFCTV
jgi:hypothetical protein